MTGVKDQIPGKIVNQRKEGEREGGPLESIGTIHRSCDPTSGVRRGRGAPRGNCNAFKHGRYAKKTLDLLKDVAASNRAMRALLALAQEELNKNDGGRRRRTVIVEHVRN